MLLGGLWHGAAWTFVVWGALHGAYLCVNHAWNNFGPDGRAALSARLANIAGVHPDVSRRRRRLGVLPRRQHAGGAQRAVEDGRSQPRSRSAALEIAQCRFHSRSMPRSPGSRPNTQEIMGYDHQNRKVGEELNGMADAAAVPLCNRRGAGVRDSRNPAAQRIHLFQVLMSNRARNICFDFFAPARPSLLLAVAAQFRRRSAAAVPAGAAVCGDVFAG